MGYSPVYSTAFVQYTDSAPNLTFDVPEGYTAIVREIDLYYEASFIAAAGYVADGPGAPLNLFVYLEGEGVLGSKQWTGRVVAPGGGVIGITTSSEGYIVSAYVGGYLLKNTVD